MTSHSFVPTILAPAKLAAPRRPEVQWFPHCFDCGTQVCLVAGKFFYRATSNLPWVAQEPPCAAKETK